MMIVIVRLLPLLFIFFACKNPDHSQWRHTTMLQEIELLIYKKDFVAAASKAKELDELLKNSSDTLLRAQTLDAYYKVTHDATALPVFEALVTQVQDDTLKAHLHVYKHEYSEAELAFRRALDKAEESMQELSLRRNAFDAKVLALHLIRTDIKLLRAELAEVLVLQNKKKDALPFIIKKDLAKLRKRDQALSSLAERPNKIGLTPEEFERLQTAKELYIMEIMDELSKKIS